MSRRIIVFAIELSESEFSPLTRGLPSSRYIVKNFSDYGLFINEIKNQCPDIILLNSKIENDFVLRIISLKMKSSYIRKAFLIGYGQVGKSSRRILSAVFDNFFEVTKDIQKLDELLTQMIKKKNLDGKVIETVVTNAQFEGTIKWINEISMEIRSPVFHKSDKELLLSGDILKDFKLKDCKFVLRKESSRVDRGNQLIRIDGIKDESQQLIRKLNTKVKK